MTKEEFYKLSHDDVVYNKKEKVIRRIISKFENDHIKNKEDAHWTRDVFNTLSDIGLDIHLKDIKNWEVYRGFERVKEADIREFILLQEISILKEIVYSHLRVEEKRIHLL